MYDFQTCNAILEEKRELELKRERLVEYKLSHKFPKLSCQEQELLNTQGHIMTMYSAILAARIAAFFCGQPGVDLGAAK